MWFRRTQSKKGAGRLGEELLENRKSPSLPLCLLPSICQMSLCHLKAVPTGFIHVLNCVLHVLTWEVLPLKLHCKAFFYIFRFLSWKSSLNPAGGQVMIYFNFFLLVSVVKQKVSYGYTLLSSQKFLQWIPLTYRQTCTLVYPFSSWFSKGKCLKIRLQNNIVTWLIHSWNRARFYCPASWMRVEDGNTSQL